MIYKVKTTEIFERQTRRLIKKYASLKIELLHFVKTLESGPEQGTPLGNSCYKVRLAVSSKGKGKSGGARIITNILVQAQEIYLPTIYDKSEKQSLSNKELRELLQQIP